MTKEGKCFCKVLHDVAFSSPYFLRSHREDKKMLYILFIHTITEFNFRRDLHSKEKTKFLFFFFFLPDSRLWFKFLASL